MHGRLADAPASQQLFVIALSLFGASQAMAIAIYFYVYFDRWHVSHRGIPGIATVEEFELVQTLPRRVWEVRLTIILEDIPNISLRRKARWSDSDFIQQTEELSIGMRLNVRLRRAPRPLVMPAR